MEWKLQDITLFYKMIVSVLQQITLSDIKRYKF